MSSAVIQLTSHSPHKWKSKKKKTQAKTFKDGKLEFCHPALLQIQKVNLRGLLKIPAKPGRNWNPTFFLKVMILITAIIYHCGYDLLAKYIMGAFSPQKDTTRSPKLSAPRQRMHWLHAASNSVGGGGGIKEREEAHSLLLQDFSKYLILISKKPESCWLAMVAVYKELLPEQLGRQVLCRRDGTVTS